MSEDFPGSALPLPVEKMTHSECRHPLLTSQRHKVMQFIATPSCMIYDEHSALQAHKMASMNRNQISASQHTHSKANQCKIRQSWITEQLE